MSDFRDHVWRELAAHPVRRAMLGRERCDAIAAETVAALDRETAVAADEFKTPWILRRAVERRVRAKYRDSCGFSFTAMIVLWAISSIAQVIVIRWWTERHEEQP